MRNRFIDYLIEKNRKAEEEALKKSWQSFSEDDPTQYNPWEENPLEDTDNER
jgi:hypothetical protein